MEIVVETLFVNGSFEFSGFNVIERAIEGRGEAVLPGHCKFG
jgi:hypothetical protein